MYVRFKILTVKPIFGQKAILIESSHEIDPLSVKPENIKITNPGDVLEELLWKDFDIKGKTITLYLHDEPKMNYRYLVRIKGLKNIIDDTLETQYSQSVEFASYIESEIRFVSPVMHSVIQELDLELEETLIEGAETGASYFEYEIASDALYQSLLIKRTKMQDKSIKICLDFKGQIFIRCRAFYEHNQLSCNSDWITTTCILKDDNVLEEPDNNEPVIQLDLEVIDTPSHNSIEQNFAYTFDTDALASIEEVSVIAKPIDGSSPIVVLQTYEIVMNNMLIIAPHDPLPKNCLITVKIKNAKAGIRTLKSFTHTFYSMLEPCYGDIKDIISLLNIELDPKIVYYHLLEASKLADYYADIKLNGNLKNLNYYNQVTYAKDFEKAMFVKYYAANQILSHTRSGLAYKASMGGKLGEIEYSPKGSLPDLTGVLKNLLTEADKWKLALQGYKDHPADPKSAVKSSRCLPHNHYRGGR